jgi:hypothetical protein
MTKQNRWTLRRRQIAAMVVAGYPRKNIASKLNISLTTVGREIDLLVAITNAGKPQKLPAILQADYPEELAGLENVEDADTLRTAKFHRQATIVFTAFVFSLVVTGYGMHLLSTAHELWNLQGFDPTFAKVGIKVAYVMLGVLLFVFGGPTERECSIVWFAMTIIDNFVLDPLLGHAPGKATEAWRTGYLEWIVENLLFLTGFMLCYLRHRQFYVTILIAAQIFSLTIHAIQTLFGALEPFTYAASIAIPYYFLWVVLAVGLCFEVSRNPRKWRTCLSLLD